MKIKGVLDRIVDGKTGVILVDDSNEEFTLDRSQLPTGAKEGDWLTIEREAGHIKSVTIDDSLTAEREKLIADKMNKLKKTTGSRFKRN